MLHKQIVTHISTLALLTIAVAPARAVTVLPACASERVPSRAATCVSTGDRGWYDGSRWRLKDTKAPEIDARSAQCRAEQIAGKRTRDRLRVLMAPGYTITFTGRSDPSGWPSSPCASPTVGTLRPS